MSASRDRDGATDDGLHGRRRRARRTAIVIAVIAALIYCGFILSGVLAQ